MSKRAIVVSFLLYLAASAVASRCLAENIFFDTGLSFNWWESNAEERAKQVWIPVSAGAGYKDFYFKIIGGYAYTDFKEPGENKRSLSHILDTKLNLTYSVVDKLPVDLMVGLDFNLPTGKTDLSNRDIVLIMQPELVPIQSFGEGFNVNPTLSFSRQWGEEKKLVTGLGLGYAVRGEYDFSTDTQDFDPGDMFSLVPQVSYYFTNEWRGRLFGNYTHYTWDTVEDDHFLQQGQLFLIGVGVDYNKERWGAGLSLTSIMREDSEIGETNQLIQRGELSQGDEWVLDLTLRYALNDLTTLTSRLRLLLIDENDEEADSPIFMGDREYASLQLGVIRKLTSHLQGEIDLKGFTMDDQQNLFHSDGDRSYHGGAVGIKLTGFF